MSHHHGGSSMAGMAGMGGMDMDGVSMFTPTNMGISKAFWYIVASFVGLGLVLNILHILSARIRKWQQEARSVSQPTVPNNRLSQLYATCQAIVREVSYPQGLYKLPRGLQWLTPPSLGKSLVILVYWAVIVAMLTSNSISRGAYYYEKIAFRAAWISIMQFPLVFVLAGKINIIGILVGSSYERLNWLHRWVARTLFVCVTLHGAMFFAEWVAADFVAFQLSALPMVKYGIGAWAVLLWINISSLLPIRSLAYEFFIIQHIVSGVIILWLLYMHIPDYARHYLWLSISFLVFDRAARLVWSVYRNIRFRSVPSATGKGTVSRIGYPAKLLALPGDVTQVTIDNVPFSWHAGQHIYLWVPRIGMIESHPFTISNACKDISKKGRAIQLAVRAHSGFSRRLYHTAQRAPDGESVKVRAFIQGPFGSYPDWNTYESLLLISASTGASFTLPILESVIQDPCCVRRVVFLLLVRRKPQCTCYLGRLRRAAAKAESNGIELEIRIAVTGSELADDDASVVNACTCGSEEEEEECCCGADDIIETASIEEGEVKKSGVSTSSSDDEIRPEHKTDSSRHEEKVVSESSVKKDPYSRYSSDRESGKQVRFSSGKYQVSRAIRRTVEEAYGETCVAVCGGQRLTSDVRNTVAVLSDERAVHKGSGAQGIYLHVEEFGI